MSFIEQLSIPFLEDTTASGAITTQNLVPEGVATAGSSVEIATNGKSAVSAQITGTYTGELSLQVTSDNVNWVTVDDPTAFRAMAGATNSASVVESGANGIYEIDSNSHTKIRITALSPITGTASITLNATKGQVTIQPKRITEILERGNVPLVATTPALFVASYPQWDLVSDTISDATISAVSGQIVATSGTQIGVLKLKSKTPFSGEIALRVAMSLSARKANQTIKIGFENALVDDSAKILFDGTTATNQKLEIVSDGATITSAALSATTTAALAFFGVAYVSGQVYIGDGVISSSTPLVNRPHTLGKILSPHENYYITIEIENTAIVTSTTLTVDNIRVYTGSTWSDFGVDMVAAATVSGNGTGSPFFLTNSSLVTTTSMAINTAYGATTTHTLVSAATTNATSVKTSVGLINALILSNTTAGPLYFKLFNKASAPTVGTDTPVANIMIPANSTISLDMGTYCRRHSLGIAYAITGASALLDNTAVAGGDVLVNMSYA